MKLFISFVFDESTSGKDGWKRGWEIIQINGKPIEDYKTSTGYDFKLGPLIPVLVIHLPSTFLTALPPQGLSLRLSTNPIQFWRNKYSRLAERRLDIGHTKASAGLNPRRSAEVT